MPYVPDRHDRRSMRLDGYDYTRGGRYYVTICTNDRLCLFGEVAEGRMHLNDWGRVADEEWRRTAVLRDNVRPDAYVVMPNDVHGIIGIMDDLDGAVPIRRRDTMHRVPTTPKTRTFGGSIAGSLPTIIGTYKTAVTRRINRQNDTSGTGESVWQPRFYDHVIRNAREHERIRRYIEENPTRWDHDRLHP